MSGLERSPEREAMYITSLIQRDVIEKLTEEIMSTIKDRIKEVTKTAFLELQPSIQTYADQLKQDLIVRLVIGDRDERSV